MVAFNECTDFTFDGKKWKEFIECTGNDIDD